MAQCEQPVLEEQAGGLDIGLVLLPFLGFQQCSELIDVLPDLPGFSERHILYDGCFVTQHFIVDKTLECINTVGGGLGCHTVPFYVNNISSGMDCGVGYKI